MKKETFIKLINLNSQLDELIDPLYEMGIDIINCPVLENIYNLIGSVAEDAYGKEGKEWIEWWIYEKSNNPELTAYEEDEDGNKKEINRTVDELYEYLENHDF